MPCRCDYMDPTSRELESVKVINFLRDEFNIKLGKPGSYGNVSNLDKDTAKLCSLCQKTNMKSKSLSLQLWWEEHQKADKEREATRLAIAKRNRDKKKLLSKLTPYERKLLNL